jgi:hypothetical protein
MGTEQRTLTHLVLVVSHGTAAAVGGNAAACLAGVSRARLADRVAPFVCALEQRHGGLDINDRRNVELEEWQPRADAFDNRLGAVGLNDRDAALAIAPRVMSLKLKGR